MKSREYFRGCHYGYAAAKEMWGKYGKSFVEHQADQLKANLHDRYVTHTDFDRGYAHAYRAVANEGPGV